MRVIGAPPGLPRTEASCPGTLPRSPRRPSTLAPTLPRSRCACVGFDTCAHLPLALAVPARHPLSRPRRSTSPVPPRAHCSVHGASARRRRPPASQPASVNRRCTARLVCPYLLPCPSASPAYLLVGASHHLTPCPTLLRPPSRVPLSPLSPCVFASALRSPPSAPMSASIMRTPVATPSVSPPSPSHACAS